MAQNKDKNGKDSKIIQQLKSRERMIRKRSYSWTKMAFLFLILISLALGLGLVQAAMIGKDALVSRLEQYINFANPYYRFVYITPGMRREEIVQKYAKALNWDESDKKWFIASAPADPDNGGYKEGYFLPKAYFVEKDATGEEVGEMMNREFEEAIEEKVLPNMASTTKTITSPKANSKNKDLKKVVNLDTAIRIASIIQREAAGPEDMNLVSGIVWNRLFAGMSLDMDATLQYIKGDENDWWPHVTGKDKYIESPYNTYQNKGLPPGAISNPSIEAINAAYNPQQTSCLFYLHDRNRKIHCTKTYEEHKKNVELYLK